MKLVYKNRHAALKSSQASTTKAITPSTSKAAQSDMTSYVVNDARKTGASVRSVWRSTKECSPSQHLGALFKTSIDGSSEILVPYFLTPFFEYSNCIVLLSDARSNDGLPLNGP